MNNSLPLISGTPLCGETLTRVLLSGLKRLKGLRPPLLDNPSVKFTGFLAI